MKLEDILIAGLLVGIGLIVGAALLVPRNDLPVLAKPVVRYKNTEEWEILKDERGSVTGVRVIRNAEES